MQCRHCAKYNNDNSHVFPTRYPFEIQSTGLCRFGESWFKCPALNELMDATNELLFV